MGGLRKREGITEKQKETLGAQNMSEFTNIYSYAICTLFHSKCKCIPKGKMYSKTVIYHPYPPKYCIPKIKIYMHLNSKRSILRNPLIPLVCVFQNQDFTMQARLVGKSLCLLLRLPSSTWSSCPRLLVLVLLASPLHRLACVFVSHPLWGSQGC